MEQNLFERFSWTMPGLEIRRAEPLSRHTSFRIGGPAAVMLCPRTETELVSVLRLCAEWNRKPAILGGGTNVLAPDEGMPLVVCTKGLRDLRRSGDCELTAQCGVPLPRLAMLACRHSLSGLEFAQGIPGTVGGGLYMNAGAFGGELSQVVVSARVLESDGSIHTVYAPEMGLGYRRSAFMERSCLILSARFRLQPDAQEAITARMQEYAAKRRSTQPLDLPSAGSAFKRPAVGFAAKMIQDSGLKGFRIGGAAVSEKHAGFVVNLGGATAADVKQLMEAVRGRVLADTGVLLQPEVRIWAGEDAK